MLVSGRSLYMQGCRDAAGRRGSGWSAGRFAYINAVEWLGQGAGRWLVGRGGHLYVRYRMNRGGPKVGSPGILWAFCGDMCTIVVPGFAGNGTQMTIYRYN